PFCRCPIRALVDIYRLAKSGLNSRTCSDDDRKPNEESNTTHRTTLDKALFDQLFAKRNPRRREEKICRAELAGYELATISEIIWTKSETVHAVATVCAAGCGSNGNCTSLRILVKVASRNWSAIRSQAAFVRRGEACHLAR